MRRTAYSQVLGVVLVALGLGLALLPVAQAYPRALVAPPYPSVPMARSYPHVPASAVSAALQEEISFIASSVIGGAQAASGGTVAPESMGGRADLRTRAEVGSIFGTRLTPPASEVAVGAGSAANGSGSDFRVRIDRLGINLPIAEGNIARDTQRLATPEDFAFHLPGTAWPGQGGNTYLYAHARTGMFLNLWGVRGGDLITITVPGRGTLRYAVTEVHPRIPPSDTSWTGATSAERLTLQTSTGPNPQDPRFVVVAVPAN